MSFVVEKQPGEILARAVDYALELPDTTLSSFTLTAIRVSDGSDATAAIIEQTSPAPAITGKKVNFHIKNGTNAVKYKITCTGIGADGQKIEVDIFLNLVAL